MAGSSGVIEANGAPLRYTTNDAKVTVSEAGSVTIKRGFAGKATITITAKETKQYLSATKQVTVSVRPLVAAKAIKKKTKYVNVSWTRCTVGTGYKVEISKKKNFKEIIKKVTINNKSKASTDVKGLKVGLYYVRVRLLNGKKGSDWSATKSFKVPR